MAWYRTGTVSVTNGSTTITGTGTAWVGAVSSGWAFNGPDGQIYEVAAVVSATQITLATPYQGGTQSGASYSIVPTQGLEQTLVSSLSNLLANYQGVYDGIGQGKFPSGSVGALSIRFEGDEDSGVYHPGSNQLGFVTGGTRRGLLSSTAFQIDVPITGTAVQSNVSDQTSGRLMKVGAFGLGGSAIDLTASDNLDNIDASGFYYNPLSGNTAGNNYPVALAGGLIVNYDGASRCVQEFTSYSSSGSFTTWRRSKSSSGWSPWRRVYDQGSAIGTVSQSAGVPTGGLIERGTNGNGEYVRFADGTQLCFSQGEQASQNPTVWTFPASFSASPSVQVTAIGALPRIAVADAITATSASIYIFTDGGAASTVVHGAVAIGRWF